MSFICVEYLCERCGERFESLEDRAAISPSLPHCGSKATRVISAAHTKTFLVTAVNRGYSPPPPRALSTRSLAEGERYSEWRKARSEARKRARREQIYRELKGT
jgi:DNA-directed RNA polymerase subunit RPC12/RpoP